MNLFISSISIAQNVLVCIFSCTNRFASTPMKNWSSFHDKFLSNDFYYLEHFILVAAIRFDVFAPKSVEAFDCSCSICKKKQNYHFIVPQDWFKLIKVKIWVKYFDFIKFGRIQIQYKKKVIFSGKVAVFNVFTNSVAYGVMPHCIDDGTLDEVIFRKVNDTCRPNKMASVGVPHFVKHTGGCHCGAVRFEVYAPKIVEAFDCSCSICTKKQNYHFIVPQARFTLLKGADNLTEYKFGTKKASHLFCKTCGVQSFYKPRSNPDGYGIMPHCIDEGTLEKVTFRKIDGKNWEKAIADNPDIKSMS